MNRTLSLAPVEEQLLVDPPLAKTVMQIRYSLTPGLVTDEAERVLGDALGRYPVRRRIVAASLHGFVGQQLVPRQETTLQFGSTNGAWTVAISESSVSLETSDYESRGDFITRCDEILQAVAAVALPPVVDRIGLRYVDVLSGTDLPRIPEFVHPEFRGLAGSVADDLQLVHSISESLVRFEPDSQLQIRSGMLPPGGTFDPLVPALDELTWRLDMDTSTTVGNLPFDPKILVERLDRFAEVAYACFRFAMTDDFVTAYTASDTSAGIGDSR